VGTAWGFLISALGLLARLMGHQTLRCTPTAKSCAASIFSWRPSDAYAELLTPVLLEPSSAM